MTSIRRHLTVRLVAGTFLVAAGGILTIYAYLRVELLEQFDDALLSRARTLASLVRVDDDTGRLEFELTERAMAEYRAGRSPDYFQVWDHGGGVLARSDSLRDRDLPQPPAGLTRHGRKRFFDLRLPDGRHGRAVEYLVEPGLEDDAGAAGVARNTPQSAGVVASGVAAVPLVLATDVGEMNESLTHVLWALLGVIGVVSVGTVLTVVGTVRRGLRPLRDIGDAVARVDPATLARPLDAAGLPEELRPVAEKLNELLARLDAAFRRERRFTSNVAHELRTPIAELRALAEVALQWPGDADATARSFADVLGVARQMESVVQALLAIARCHGGQQALAFERVDFAELVAEAWRPHAATADARGLDADVRLPPGIVVVVESDRAVLGAILRNLFSNATLYTPPAGRIWCRGEVRDGRYVFELLNENGSLTPGDLRLLTEPFWRKDPARSDSANSGLGLALVDTYAKLLRVNFSVALPSADTFSATLAVPLAAPAPRLVADPAAAMPASPRDAAV